MRNLEIVIKFCRCLLETHLATGYCGGVYCEGVQLLIDTFFIPSGRIAYNRPDATVLFYVLFLPKALHVNLNEPAHCVVVAIITRWTVNWYQSVRFKCLTIYPRCINHAKINLNNFLTGDAG